MAASFATKAIKVTKSLKPSVIPALETLTFGTQFSNHMLEADWTRANGWTGVSVREYGNLSLSPAASSLHYGLQVFEGMKAYKCNAGIPRLFRPDKNARRMITSCARLALPTFHEDDFVEAVKQLVRIDHEFIPAKRGFSLYLRPTMISSNSALGVAATDAAKFFIIASPVGPYYANGFKPVKLWVDADHKRAWPGGTGAYKVGGNYAPTIAVSKEAAAKGYAQVLWLGPGDEIDEVGAMNFMLIWKNKEGKRELITAPLDGTILPGVTRDSILELARESKEFDLVSEKRFTIHDLVHALSENRVEEMFGCGTAAIVSQVSGLNYRGTEYSVNISDNSFAVRMMNEILAIQYGERAHPWSVVV